ncbi:MAG TPA: adenylate/guanylate cyclase domain-containing protein, partial [Devosiaceae bacterium]|nr:adenylate/guanylate cyclase domain-containing protein [Devosiaceae bacterium]
MVQADRKLVPIVSLDVVGYSRLVEHSEHQTLRLVRTVYEVLVHRTIEEQGGKVFKTMGDGLLAEFQSVIAAVQWTATLQRELSQRRLRAPGGEVFRVRAGIVLADVLVSGGDLFGSGINLAVRVQSHAPPGGMAITKWMFQYLGAQTDLVFEDLGPTELKNISKSVRLFVWHPEQLPRPAPQPTPLVPSDRPSVVVLPFDNMSAEADQAYFADAVVEEITATLSRIRDFFVIARNSAFAYKGRALDVRQVGRELGVRYAVEGSVRRVGERVRITAQLVETDTANHIWSSKVDGHVNDLFDLQDRIAAEVASALHPSIRRAEIERALSKHPDSLVAYDLVMRALPHLWAHRMAENPKAIALLEQALKREPNYGLAAALGAWAHAQQVVYNWTADFDAARRKGEALVEVATMTVGEEPTALTALAAAITLLGGDVRQAVRFADKALALDPNHAWAWMRRGYGKVYLGEPEEGIVSFERAARLSPLDPFAFNNQIGMGLANFSLGRFDEALRLVTGALAERPGLTWPFRDVAVYRAWLGDLEGARDALEKFVYLRPVVTLQSIADSLRFMNASLLQRYVE